MADLRAFGIDPILDMERFLLKLNLLAEYAELRLRAEGDGSGLERISAMLNDMALEGDRLHGALQRQVEVEHVRQ